MNAYPAEFTKLLDLPFIQQHYNTLLHDYGLTKDQALDLMYRQWQEQQAGQNQQQHGPNSQQINQQHHETNDNQPNSPSAQNSQNSQHSQNSQNQSHQETKTDKREVFDFPTLIVKHLVNGYPQIRDWLNTMGYLHNVRTVPKHAQQFLTSLASSQPNFLQLLKTYQSNIISRIQSAPSWPKPGRNLENYLKEHLKPFHCSDASHIKTPCNHFHVVTQDAGSEVPVMTPVHPAQNNYNLQALNRYKNDFLQDLQSLMDIFIELKIFFNKNVYNIPDHITALIALCALGQIGTCFDKDCDQEFLFLKSNKYYLSNQLHEINSYKRVDFSINPAGFRGLGSTFAGPVETEHACESCYNYGFEYIVPHESKDDVDTSVSYKWNGKVSKYYCSNVNNCYICHKFTHTLYECQSLKCQSKTNQISRLFCADCYADNCPTCKEEANYKFTEEKALYLCKNCSEEDYSCGDGLVFQWVSTCPDCFQVVACYECWGVSELGAKPDFSRCIHSHG